MTTISESANPCRPTVELAMRPAPASEQNVSDPEETADDDGFYVFGEDGFTFLDFLDIINPLQHIPFISTLYRELTGDTIDPGSQVIGSTLFFGPIGTLASLGNIWLEDNTGKDMSGHAMAFFGAEDLLEPELAKAEGETVIDVGSATLNPQSTQPARAEEVDPVTAWAMAEITYRKSAPGKFVEGPEQAAPRNIGAVSPPIAVPVAAPVAVSVAAKPSLTTAEALSMLRDVKRGSALYAAASRGNQPVEREDRKKRENTNAPPGAVAYEGGWFSETMLSAMGKYEDGTGLNGTAPPHALNLTR